MHTLPNAAICTISISSSKETDTTMSEPTSADRAGNNIDAYGDKGRGGSRFAKFGFGFNLNSILALVTLLSLLFSGIIYYNGNVANVQKSKDDISTKIDESVMILSSQNTAINKKLD